MSVKAILMSYENLQERDIPRARLPDGFTLGAFEYHRRVSPFVSDPEDGAEVHWLKIMQKTCGEFMAEWTTEKFLNRFALQPQFKRNGFFLVKHGSEYVASVFAWEDKLGSSVGRLHYLAVLPDYQRQGLGTALCLHILEYFKNQGKSSVTLTTEEFRDDAIRLYKSIGFQTLDEASQ